MLAFLDIAAREVEEWVRKPESCEYSDMALHNSLYYSGRLPFAVAVENRAKEGIAVAVDKFASEVIVRHTQNMMEAHEVSAEKGTRTLLVKRRREGRSRSTDPQLTVHAFLLFRPF